MAAPERMVSLSELAAKHLSRGEDLECSTPASTGTLFLGLPQSSRALPLLLPPTPTVSGFCRGCPQAAIIQRSPGVDAHVRPKITSFKGFLLIQDHLDHSATTFKDLISVRTETMAAPERTLSLSEMAAQHLTKNKELRSSIAAIITPVNSGGTDTFLGLQDLSKALAPLLSPTASPSVFSLSCPQALISQNSPGVDADVRPKVTSPKGFPSLPELLQDHSHHRSTAFKPLTSAQPDAITEKMLSMSELLKQHLSMDIDLQSPATTLIFSETTSASPSSLGTALCLSASPKRSRKHQSESKVRAGSPPRCPSLTPAMFHLPPIRGESSDTPNGAISAAAAKQQKTQERKLKREDVLVLWPGQIEVVLRNTFYQVLYHPLPKFTNPDPQRPPIVPFQFDTPSPDDIALERKLKPYTWKKKSYRISRRLNQTWVIDISISFFLTGILRDYRLTSHFSIFEQVFSSLMPTKQALILTWLWFSKSSHQDCKHFEPY